VGLHCTCGDRIQTTIGTADTAAVQLLLWRAAEEVTQVACLDKTLRQDLLWKGVEL